MVADHFPFAVFEAVEVGGADVDGGIVGAGDVDALFDVVDDGEGVSSGDVDLVGFDFAAEFEGGLFFPVFEDGGPADLEPAAGAHVSDVVGVGPDGFHGFEVAFEHGVEGGVEFGVGEEDGFFLGGFFVIIGEGGAESDGEGEGGDREGDGFHGDSVPLVELS